MSSPPKPAKQIFLDAIEAHAPEQWPAFLDQACGDDAQLRRRVGVLLEAHVADGSLLDNPAVALAATLDPPHGERVGDSIGPYKLREMLGEGGMGNVYVAEQEMPIRRKVALKIIKPGMDSREVLARFEAERQALALMDHPNIARVLDAGTTESGLPYFVMELVRGVPITEFCDQRRLDPRQRLELFVQVCRAVQHAHQKGIIHRDIKPSNILVTLHDDLAVPKIIDFGIAKATSQRLIEQSVYTAFNQMIGTPLYMSPEQAEMNALDVDTRSDVYSLGVLLYELLTGSTPFDRNTLLQASFDEMRRLIRDVEPPRPSQRVSTLNAEADSTVSKSRGVDERRLGRVLQGELDWIVMKALEKDRNRRFESASALADDVQHHLDGEPIEACPVSAVYRLQKFWRRNRTALATVAAVIAALVSGSGISIWQAIEATQARTLADEALDDVNHTSRELSIANANLLQQTQRAETNLKLARHIIDKAFTQEAERLNKVPHLNGTQRQLFQAVVDFYEGLPKQETGDPEVRWESAQAYFQLGSAYCRLSRLALGVQALERAVGVYSELVHEFPDSVKYRRNLAEARALLGNTLKDMGDIQRAQQNFIEAIRGYREIVVKTPGDVRSQDALATWLIALSATYAKHDMQKRMPLQREALALFDRLVLEHRDDSHLRQGLTVALLYHCETLWNSGSRDEAMTAIRKCIDIATTLVASSPDDHYNRDILAAGYYQLARLIVRQGKFTDSDVKEATRLTREGMRIYRQLGAETPDYARIRLREAYGYPFLVELLPIGEAESEYRNWIGYLKSLLTQFPEVTDFRDELNAAYTSFVDRLLSLNRPEDAEPWAREALRWNESLAKQSPRDGGCRYGLIQSKVSLFRVLDRLKRWRNSQRDMSELMRDAEQLLADNPGKYRHRVADEFRKCYTLLTDSPDPQVRDPLRATQLATRTVELAPDAPHQPRSQVDCVRPSREPHVVDIE